MTKIQHRSWSSLLALLLVTAFSALFPASHPLQAALAHPRIIVSRAEFPALRARAAKEPWASMQADALTKAGTLSYDSKLTLLPAATRMRNIASAIALAYILDSDAQRRSHAQRLYAQLKLGLPDLESKRVGIEDTWEANVPFGNAFFSSVIGLDIVYDDLTASERAELEQLLEECRAAIHDTHRLSTIAVYGVWDVYTANGNLPARRNEYLTELNSEITPDGVFAEGAGYGLVRFGDTQREQKTLFMDVLEYQGYHDFYSNPHYQTFYRWLYDHAVTPSGKSFGFGDSTADGGVTTLGYAATTSLLRAGRFGDAVLRAASRHVGSGPFDGQLLSYILMQTPPKPELASQPVSQVYPDSGAWFVDGTNGTAGLSGALRNLVAAASKGHLRPETNSIALAGYGEQLLTNAGYPGFGEGALGFTWDYIHKRAIAGNTVLIDYDPQAGGAPITNPSATNDHSALFGGGISESLLSDDLEYARGESKDALPNGSQARSFVYVRPQRGVNGYWLLFDSVDATRPNAVISSVLHPYSTKVTTESAKLSYRATIRQVESGSDSPDVRLNIFYATPPTTVTLGSGVISSFRSQSTFVGTSLLASYASNGAGQQQIATVLFPEDATHGRAALQRITSGGAQPAYSGARIDHGGGSVDYALVSSGTTTLTYSPTAQLALQFQADDTFYRLEQGTLASAFMGHGRALRVSTQGSTTLGISADNPISAQYDGARWQISAAAARSITLTLPNITQVLLDGVPAEPLNQNGDSITLRVGAGSHTLRARTGSPLSREQIYLSLIHTS